MMKRHITRALIVGVIFIITYYVFRVLRSMYLTYNYVPDIIKSYDSAEHLQHKVSFGISGDLSRILFEVLGLLSLGMIMYFGIRMIRGRRK